MLRTVFYASAGATLYLSGRVSACTEVLSAKAANATRNNAGMGRTSLILPKKFQLSKLPHTEFPRSWVGYQDGASATHATFRWGSRIRHPEISTACS